MVDTSLLIDALVSVNLIGSAVLLVYIGRRLWHQLADVLHTGDYDDNWRDDRL